MRERVVRASAEAALVLLACLDAWIWLTLLDRDAEAPLDVDAGLLFFHTIVALAQAAGIVVALSRRWPRERLGLFALATALAWIVPVLGGLGMLAVAFAARGPARRGAERWAAIDLAAAVDERVESPHPPPHRVVRPSNIANTLADPVPDMADARFRAVLRVKYAPLRARVPLLRLALKDPADEVRLFAFSRLERTREGLDQALRDFTTALAAATSDEARAQAHLRRAETYWEMAYGGLVEGAGLERTLFAALADATRGSELRESAPAEFLRGRILLALDRVDVARSAFERALAAGHARSRVVPYLAECDFRQRRVAAVREHLRSLTTAAQASRRLGAVVEFWH